MSSLLAALANGGNALRQFERAVALTQSEVVNASTPGYVSHQLRFVATPFAPESGLYGGVSTGALESTRDEFAESAVRRQTSHLGFASQQAQSLSGIEAVFELSSDQGLAGALQGLFDAFSGWSTLPNDANRRQTVIAAAETVAVGFRQTAGQLAEESAALIEVSRTLAAKVNGIGRDLAELNRTMRQGASDSASVEAEVFAKLEELSEIADFSVVRGTDNTMTILLAGHVPLVVADHAYEISAEQRAVATPGSPPALRILDASGQDITGLLTTGRFGAVIESVNGTLGSLLGDDTQAGSLNRLATAFATRVNALLSSGSTADGSPGTPLFEVTADGSAAAMLRVTEGIHPDDLAAIEAGPPVSANGIAMRLAGLSSPAQASDMLEGASYLDYLGRITAGVGRAVSTAKSNEARRLQLASQARSLRSEVSGVSLDEEAVRLVEFQRAYEAAARTVTTINEMLETLLRLGQ